MERLVSELRTKVEALEIVVNNLRQIRSVSREASLYFNHFKSSNDNNGEDNGTLVLEID